jgi:hypothetical protein
MPGENIPESMDEDFSVSAGGRLSSESALPI